jgi:hypothetical protein
MPAVLDRWRTIANEQETLLPLLCASAAPWHQTRCNAWRLMDQQALCSPYRAVRQLLPAAGLRPYAGGGYLPACCLTFTSYCRLWCTCVCRQ